MPSNFPLNNDGILGKDFMDEFKVNVDYCNRELNFYFNDEFIQWKFIASNNVSIIPPRSEM